MSDNIKLSICITTFKRAAYIGQTLDSIIPQLQSGVELVVVDGASPDNTPEVMAEYLVRYPFIRYYRQEVNSGIDADYDKAVGYARGEFCWLMTDDDLLAGEAVSRVLSAINDKLDLIVVNAEVRNSDLSQVLNPYLISLGQDRQFAASENEEFFKLSAQALSFIGCVVIRRSIWTARDRETFYGTLFVHVGVIFQSPPLTNVKLLAAPLISIRFGNAMWTARGFEIWMFKWPGLVWSFADFSDLSKAVVFRQYPWRSLKLLALYRALGGYTHREFSTYLADNSGGLSRLMFCLIAVFPGKLMNALISLHCAFLSSNAKMGMYSLLKSKNANWITRMSANRLGVSDKA